MITGNNKPGAAMEKTVKEVLQATLAVFGPNGENWVRGHGGDNPQCCSVTAFYRAKIDNFAEGSGSDAYRLLCRLAKTKEGSLSKWNDRPKRKFADVKKLWERAIKSCSRSQMPRKKKRKVSHD
jgi:hypothetical protein